MAPTLLSEKWIKASIIGTIWAAFEIVLGSFFHNLKIPFSSNVLTAIGIIILISISYVWTEKGLFWRAGLICALMKTLSPSAVIFGPMIAIFSEALLLEFSIRVFGRTLLGYLLGGMLAMSWNLFHMVMNYLLLYGFNIVKIYTQLLAFTQQQLNIHFDIVWLPILVLLLLYCSLGLLSVVIGIRVGRKIKKQPTYNPSNLTTNNEINQKETLPHFNYSIIWLFANIILLIGGLFLLKSSWEYWASAITVLVIVWAIRYKRAFRQLVKPKFWLTFVLLTMLTAFVFSQFQGKSWTEAFSIGIQMNYRAVLIITGFSVLGTELFNPKIRAFFQQTYFKQLPLALELSFESLPQMISHIPDAKTIFKNPVGVLYQIISQAEYRLSEIKNKTKPQLIIVTGAIGEGKTTQMEQLIQVLKAKNFSIGGIYSPKIIENGITTGYDIVNSATGNRKPFLRIADEGSLNTIGRFQILSEGLLFGQEVLLALKNEKAQIIIIDEVGKLELDNQGWAPAITEIVNITDSIIIMAVRNSFTEAVIQKWAQTTAVVYPLSEFDTAAIASLVTKQIELKISPS